MALFKNSEHEERYNEVLNKMKKQDGYHQSAAYLIALDDALYENINSVFDFDDDKYIIFGLAMRAWQTGTSIKTTHLMLNLWNGTMGDLNENYSVEDNSFLKYGVDEIFSSNLAFWYFEAVKLRFPHIAQVERSVR